MRSILSFISILLISGCATPGAQDQVAENDSSPQRFISSHETHFPHPHKHGKNCGHSSETVGFDTVYDHDGHKHKMHADHVDDIK